MKTLSLREAKVTRPDADKKYVIIALQPAGNARYAADLLSVTVCVACCVCCVLCV